jgi:hypothetical protein
LALNPEGLFITVTGNEKTTEGERWWEPGREGQNAGLRFAGSLDLAAQGRARGHLFPLGHGPLNPTPEKVKMVLAS